MTPESRSLEDLKVPESQWLVLVFLNEKKQSTFSDIMQSTGLKLSTAWYAVNALKEGGFLEVGKIPRPDGKSGYPQRLVTLKMPLDEIIRAIASQKRTAIDRAEASLCATKAVGL